MEMETVKEMFKDMDREETEDFFRGYVEGSEVEGQCGFEFGFDKGFDEGYEAGYAAARKDTLIRVGNYLKAISEKEKGSGAI